MKRERCAAKVYDHQCQRYGRKWYPEELVSFHAPVCVTHMRLAIEFGIDRVLDGSAAGLSAIKRRHEHEARNRDFHKAARERRAKFRPVNPTGKKDNNPS